MSVNGQGEREGERGEGAFGLPSLCEYMRSKAGSYVVTYFAASTGTEPSVGADLNHLPSSSSSFPFPFLSLSPLKRTSQRAGSVPYPVATRTPVMHHAPNTHARARTDSGRVGGGGAMMNVIQRIKNLHHIELVQPGSTSLANEHFSEQKEDLW